MRQIKNPRDVGPIRRPPVPKKVDKTTLGRESALAKRAKVYGVNMTIGPTNYYFTKNGVKWTVFGLWAAEQFVRGIECAHSVQKESREAGKWRDNNE